MLVGMHNIYGSPDLSVGYLDGKAINNGERRPLPIGIGLEELGEQLVVLVAQVRVQRG